MKFELKNSHNSFFNSDILQKEEELRKKERELDNLNKTLNRSSSDTDKNSKFPFYITFAIMAIIIVFLVALLVNAKRKKQSKLVN